MTAPALAQADQFCMCGCLRSRHKGKGMCKDCGEFECDRFEVDKSRLPAPGADAESTSARLRRVEAERDSALALIESRDADKTRVLEQLGKTEQHVRDLEQQCADFMRGRDEATDRALELAKRVAELERQFADVHGSLQRARQRVGDLERQLAASMASNSIDDRELERLREQFAATQGQPAVLIPADVVVHTYPALYCRTCYGRFLEDTDAAETHRHPLVPVTVTITERTTSE